MPDNRSKRLFDEAIWPRLEIIVTLVIDTAVLLVAFGCRWITLKTYRLAVAGTEVAWHLRLLEYVLDYGLVAAAIALVVFDLGKRLRTGFRNLTRDD